MCVCGRDVEMQMNTGMYGSRKGVGYWLQLGAHHRKQNHMHTIFIQIYRPNYVGPMCVNERVLCIIIYI